MPGDTTRPLTTMEFFLLALIGKAEVDTTYALQKKTGLAWGGVRPSLRRLEEEGYLGRAPLGPRGRKEFRLTQEGWTTLEERWWSALDHGADLETIVRAAWLCWLMEPRRTPGFLEQAAVQRRQRHGQHGQSASRHDAGSDWLQRYLWLRSAALGSQCEAEAETFSHLAQNLATKVGRA